MLTEVVSDTDGPGAEKTTEPRPLHHQAVASRVRHRLFGRGLEPVRIGRYALLDPLGAGAMGVVYAAYDDTLDRKVAVKLLLREREKSELAQQRMLREARAMARLSHPNVVQVYEAGIVDGQVFLAMEYVAGGTLRDALYRDDAPRPWREIVDAFIAVGRGLAAAHDQGVIHRDFKPDNVLVPENGAPKVADFGLAGLGQGDPSPDVAALSPEDPALTATGSILGTPRYMAPELHRGEDADARSDQFAFCVALFEALFGAPPFDGTTRAGLATFVTAGKIAPVSQRGVPRRLARAVRRGLARDAEDRWSDMRALVAELQSIRARRARAVWISAAALVAAFAAWGEAGTPDTASPCADAGREVAALAIDAEPIAAHAERWAELRREGCEAHVAGELSADLYDRRQICLDVALGRLAAATRLASPQPPAMLDLDACDDAVRLTSGPSLPAEGPSRDAYLALRQRLADLEVAAATGMADVATLEQLVADAEEDGDARAQALLLLGQAQRASGAVAQATDALHRAAVAADRARNDDVRARALIELVWVHGVDARDPAASRRIALAAAAALERRGSRDDLEALLAEARGMTELYAGELDLAADHLRAAAGHADGGALASTIHANLASVLLRQGRPAEASAQLRIALRQAGDEPTAAGLLNNLGFALGLQGLHAEALTVHQRSLTLRETLWGPGDIRVANALNGIGLARLGLDQPGDAIAPLERSLALHERGAGRAEDRAEAEFALARALADRDLARARDLAVAAARRYRAPELAGLHAHEIELVENWIASHGHFSPAP